MKIRAITLGVDWKQCRQGDFESDLASFFADARARFSQAGFEPRTCRVALPSAVAAPGTDLETTREMIDRLSMACRELDIRWFVVPFQGFGKDADEVNSLALEFAQQYENAFINYLVTQQRQLDRQAILSASAFVRDVSQLSDNGFDNFRCGVSFNCRPNGAFFPFTYQEGNQGFSLALELVPQFLDTIRRHAREPLEIIRNAIIEELSPMLRQLDCISQQIEKSTGMNYYGMDTSLAPHPEDPEHSVALIVEQLGIDKFGASGTVFATSILTDTLRSLIKSSGVRATGFNGVMYSLLEDRHLSTQASESEAPLIDTLLACSTMCGCGLDMLPLPGDISVKEISAIMLDVAAIAICLDKPLGVRLLPVPGKCAGDFTEFDHDFIHNTRIQEAKYKSCSGGLLNVAKPFAYLVPRYV